MAETADEAEARKAAERARLYRVRSDPRTTAKVDVGSIVQIDPEFDHAGAGGFAIVVEKHAWGIIVDVPSLSLRTRLAWQWAAATGGKAVWAADGERLAPEPQLLVAHNP